MPLVPFKDDFTFDNGDVATKTKLSETIVIGKVKVHPMLWHLPVWSRES